ncbi:hypothetical protein CGCFRS4_v001241 [Colletotrichum fructicola]|nr:hypothetical protein CGCFRS4_v001241 [Colletotrichum fructicola]KAF4938225.1 hypothetical protein CGCF245_v004742 [Colletotrichum fructicola]
MALPPGVIKFAPGGGGQPPPPPPPPPPHPAGAKVPHHHGPPPPPPPPPGRAQVPGPFAVRHPGPPPPPVRPVGGQMPPAAVARPPIAHHPAHPGPIIHHMPPPVPLQQMPVQQVPIQPPRDKIPPELRERRLVEYSDLRSERMTDASAREYLSEYVVYRFEKVLDPMETDIEGFPTKPTWENVRRVEVRDLSRKDIIRNIRELNEEGQTALQKKMDLTPNQQLQIEKAQNALEKRNTDKRYRYTLQQISSKMKKLHKDSYQYQQYMADREAKKVVVARGKSALSKSKKNLFETIAVTAYFRKEPRFEEDALAMYRSKKEEEILIQQRESEARNLHFQRQMQQDRHHAEFLMHQQHQAQQERLRPPPQQLPPLPPIHKLPPPPKATAAPIVKVVEKDHGKGGKCKTYIVPSSGSRTSSSSNFSSELYDTETEDSPDSSESSKSKHGRRRRGRRHSRSRSRSRRRGRPEEYGLKGLRHHTRSDGQDPHYILDSEPLRGRLLAAPTSPTALPMLDGPAYIEESLLARRIASRQEPYGVGDLEDQLEDMFNRRRAAPSARVIQRDLRDLPIRRVEPQEVARRRHDDDLENVIRLKLEDEAQFEHDRRMEEDFEAEGQEIARRHHRSMERRFRRPSLDRGRLFRPIPPETYEEEAARDYMRERERPARTHFDNPFDPLGRGTRRNSFGYRP